MRSTPYDRSDAPWASAAGQLGVGLCECQAVWRFVWLVALVVPRAPVASRSQPVSITVAALSAASGPPLLALALLRFHAFGSPQDPLTGTALCGAPVADELARRLCDPHTSSLAIVQRQLAYVLLLVSPVPRIRQEIAEREGREELLCLSRHLHDGLAQRLSMLHMRLDHPAAPLECNAEGHRRVPAGRNRGYEAHRGVVR
jgi:signal transduction histidine kinase